MGEAGGALLPGRLSGRGGQWERLHPFLRGSVLDCASTGLRRRRTCESRGGRAVRGDLGEDEDA